MAWHVVQEVPDEEGGAVLFGSSPDVVMNPPRMILAGKSRRRDRGCAFALIALADDGTVASSASTFRCRDASAIHRASCSFGSVSAGCGGRAGWMAPCRSADGLPCPIPVQITKSAAPTAPPTHSAPPCRLR